MRNGPDAGGLLAVSEAAECELLAQYKALANRTRMQILHWLKDPRSNFPELQADSDELGVCVGLIQRKAGTSASTISAHLAVLQRAGFLTATRRGQWTYYRRDEGRIRHFTDQLHRVL
ncbi:ArsR/SmtB family transcription factor [Nocardia veterana]|uniref:ArsR/SmtB family transcription factor n=1 Tax=Nocardia veterana TaxID=132249 RepID=UPI00031DC252|nr:metalloregulator ArsR/SmtB family transcription factor [Nocardia veterana]